MDGSEETVCLKEEQILKMKIIGPFKAWFYLKYV